MRMLARGKADAANPLASDHQACIKAASPHETKVSANFGEVSAGPKAQVHSHI